MTACAETKPATYTVKESQGSQEGGGYKIGKPYQIGGVWYYPAEDYSYAETGIASWYGPDFHGKYTANGEVFDQNEVTAAHRTLPMPSFVRVTNLENGRSLVIRVNDRGPFAHSRIIDLSRRAAQLLGIENQGTAKVRVEIMADESRALALRLKAKGEDTQVAAAPREAVQAETLPPPGSKEAPQPIAKAAPPESRPVAQPPDSSQLANQPVKTVPVKATQMFVQAGAFSRYDNAHRLSAALSALGPTNITQVATKAGTLFRVRMGPLANLDAADTLLEKVIASGYPDAKLVVD
jgi:rare lipoprotein A